MKLDVFKECPSLENEDFLIRFIEQKDAEDLLNVYSDCFALPFFNSDNCHGSNFYITNLLDMNNTIFYWLKEYYEYKGFVRFSIIDKKRNHVIGTIEIFKRTANDYFNECGLLRVDVGSPDEESSILTSLFSLISIPFMDWFDCKFIATKAPIYAVERIKALRQAGYVKSNESLIGHDDTHYYDYWIMNK
ncbi:MAG: hypothetical protein NC087_10000 [Anaeroplasma bactoclasticum]|nr:hypothetical protein [Anaeroplasma bactoclasticum]MCM1557839.1 hypothetical protein [Anaeroplasma bactoclasticum]